MRILFVASRFPYPLIQGDRLRAYHQMRLLSRHHQVTLVAPEPDTDDRHGIDAVRGFCEQVHVVRSSQWYPFLRLLRAPFTDLPWQTLFCYDPRFCRCVYDLLHAHQYDLIHVQLVRMAPVLDGINGIPAVLDLIDALSLNIARRARCETWLKRCIFTMEARRLRRYEQRLVEKYNQLTITSLQDQAAIGAYSNLHVVPNGVDGEDFPYREDGRDSHTILFSGRMGYFPNADAATWFCREVLPLVRAQIPEAKVLIVGADPAPAVQKLAEISGVAVAGRVPALQPYLHQATVAVAPLRTGSGIQNKILEAMACGAPVVATPQALGGLRVSDGLHLLVADSAASFAEQVVRVLCAASLQRSLGRRARSLVEEMYTWDAAVRQLEAVYELAVHGESPPAIGEPQAQGILVASKAARHQIDW